MADEMKKGVTIGSKDDKGSTAVEEREFSEKETTNQLLMNEEDILQGLVDAASFSDDDEQTTNIKIMRPDRKTGQSKLLFQFRVRALTEQEYNNCKIKHTKYVRNKRLGMKLPEDTDSSRYRASIIYAATIPEDRKKLWDNKDAWEALRNSGKQIVRGLDVIENCLLAGEKDRVIDVIDRLSGYSDDIEEVESNLENMIKN